ncbi:hypothetical protein K1719_033884 [Acacia pycnantha]|nr:hypothetical protein K1719_033884 [Acacia pycnantha]
MNKGKTSVKSEQGDSSEPTKEIMTFGSTVLVKYPLRHSKAFKPLPHLPTPMNHGNILEKPLSKNFSFYVLFRGERPGIYINYPELVKAIGNSSRPFWQGFYSFQEAWNQATVHHRTPSDGRYRIDQDVTSWFNTDGEYIYNGLLKLVINLDRPTQVLNGEECPIDYMEFLSYGMVAAFSKGKYRQNFHHFLVTPLIEQTEEGLTEPQCDKFLRDARLYESLGNKYAEDYNSLSFDTVVKKSCYQVWIPKDRERLGLVQAGVLDPNPENYGDDGMFDDEYMADTD